MEASTTPSTCSANESTTKQGRFWGLFVAIVATGILGSRLVLFTSDPDDSPDQESPKPSKSFLSHLLVGLLVFSALVALADAFRARLAVPLDDKTTQKTITRQTSLGGFKRPPLTRRCSLVDLTMSRHERREVALQNHHQPVSLPETSEPPSASFRYPRRRPPPLSRHSSFFSASRGSEYADMVFSSATAAAALRRPSLELSDPDASPDTRRRCSRLIRRH